MEKRNLGNSGLAVYPLCFGGNVFGWTIDQAQSFTLLDAFVDAGFNFVDTADVYSVWKPGNEGGESEKIIGEWLKQSGKRDKVVIATKVGMALSPEKKGLAAKSVAHLAASLGRPVWNLLGFYAYWLYLHDRADSPWYPTMKLIRQQKPGDWDGVFERVERELRNMRL